MKLRKCCLAIAVVVGLLWGTWSAGRVFSEDDDAVATKLQNPEVWVSMHPRFAEILADKPEDWDYVREHLTGVNLNIDPLNKASSKQLTALATLLQENSIQVMVECGGTLNHDWQEEAGEKSAKVELGKLEKWYQAGGTIDYLNLDGPVRRLLGHGWGKDDDKRFTSYEKCADELVDYMQAVSKAHPEIQYLLLTNFPNWGYKKDVSYHARGPARQDYGDYYDVVKTVLKVVKAADLELAGVTVDNPYEYAIGTHHSVKLKDPKKVNWIKRIRHYEKYSKNKGLEFNLIINSEQGGKTSDQEFYERTLKMLDVYRKAKGTPDRYLILTWYAHPKELLPETDSYSLMALTKAVMLKLHPE